MRTGVVGLMSAAVATLLAGCDAPVCTLIGAPEGLIVKTQPALQNLSPGAYTFTARADGVEVSITGTAGPFGGACTPCQADVQAGSHRLSIDSVSGGADEIVVGYLDGGGPATVEIALSKDGAPLVTHTYTPAYRPVEINGAGCGVTMQAHDSFAVPVP